ncbi:hypothetical protein HK105_209059 [Polyrhizophydium stewartii]|uniref:Ankyrin repeat protein n=1 Tax=Polyrhizophydium stewartii TaxID=2732419 RepID=A0ABR4MW26_9FUNG
MDASHAAHDAAASAGQHPPAGHAPAEQHAAGAAALPPAARLAADTNHPTAGVAALPPEPAAAARPAAPPPPRPLERFRASATNEWDRMPAEIQNKILDAAGPFTKFVNGLLLAAELWMLSDNRREQVWQDVIDTDWQGDLDLLPPIDIASKSLNIRSRSFLERCHNRFDRTDIVRVAVRNSWTDLFDFERPGALAETAAIEGALDVLVDLIDVRKIAKPTTQLALVAAEKGHLDVVKFVHERMPGGRWENDVANVAAQSGNLDLVVWLKEHHPECFGREAYQGVALRNHLHIVRWLADSCDFDCDSGAFYWAAFHNNLGMLQFLSERFPHIQVQLGSNSLVASDARVLEWLRERSLLKVEGIYVRIAQTGNIEAYEWAKQRFGVEIHIGQLLSAYYARHNDFVKHVHTHDLPFDRTAAGWAAEYCNTEIMNWAISRDRGVIPMLVGRSAKFGHLVLIEWWRVQHGVVFGQQEFVAAVRLGNVKIVKHMIAADSGDLDLEAALAASTQPAGPFNLIEATQGILRYAIANRAAKPK